MALSLWLNPWLGLALILPGLVPHFFTGGAAGVYGNASGGRIGAVVGGFLNGLMITFLPALLLEVLGDFGDANTTFGDTDFGWVGIATGYPALLGAAGIPLIALVGAAILGAAIMWQKRVVDTGWDPAPHRAVRDAAAGESSTPERALATKIAPPRGAPTPPPPPTD